MDLSKVKCEEERENERESERLESNNVISGKEERLFKGEVGILAALVLR